MDMEILKVIADNPALEAALKKLLLSKFSLDTLGTNYPNEVLGQLTRSRLEGREAVELAFQDIKIYQSRAKQSEPVNPAR